MVESSAASKISSSNFVGRTQGRLNAKYRIGKVLGTGAFGEVRTCVHRETGAQRAVKVLRKQEMSDTMKEMLFNEINILSTIDHPNIVKMYEFFEDDKRFFIVTEICKGGELFDELMDRGTLSERDAAVIMKQILSVVYYCHQQNVAHRDLKPENVMLEQDKSFEMLKVIDFGTAVKLEPGEHLCDTIGTPYYVAPEVLDEWYDLKCDVWSCGVIAYVLLSARPPFLGQTDQETFKAIRKQPLVFPESSWGTISDSAKDFISKCLIRNVNDRPTSQQILQHEWFSQNATDQVEKQLARTALQNFRQFQADATFKKACFAFIASQLLTKRETEEMSKVFKVLDSTGDGHLQCQEMKVGYREHFGIEVPDDEIEAMFAKIDTAGSGYIDYSEFVVAALEPRLLIQQDKLQAAFRMFDKSGCGIITVAAIRNVLQFRGSTPLSNEAMDQIIKQVDAYGDGEISFEEFFVMMADLDVEQ